MSDSLRDRLAELMKQTDFRPAPAAKAAPQEPRRSQPLPPSPPRRIECARCDGTGWEKVVGGDGCGRVRRCDHRVVHVTPPPQNVVQMPTRRTPRCEHKWSIQDGKRTCWLCGMFGGTVADEASAPRSVEDMQADAERQARALDHVLGPWKKRPNDQYGRLNAWCRCCNKLAVVSVEQAPGLPLVYGEALLRKCGD